MKGLLFNIECMCTYIVQNQHKKLMRSSKEFQTLSCDQRSEELSNKQSTSQVAQWRACVHQTVWFPAKVRYIEGMVRTSSRHRPVLQKDSTIVESGQANSVNTLHSRLSLLPPLPKTESCASSTTWNLVASLFSFNNNNFKHFGLFFFCAQPNERLSVVGHLDPSP